jgi:hypothetical protein
MNLADVGGLLLSSARSVEMLHACIAQSVARAGCSSAGVSYAVVARDLDGTFTCAVVTSRGHRSDLSQRYREVKNIR